MHDETAASIVQPTAGMAGQRPTRLGLVVPFLLLAPAVAATVVLCWFAWSYEQPPPGGREFIFAVLTMRYDPSGAIASLVVLLAALALPLQPSLKSQLGSLCDRVVAWLGERRRTVAAGAGLALAALSLVAYHAYPVSMDEYAMLLQARIFAAGRIVGRWPPSLVLGMQNPGNADTFVVASCDSGDVLSAYSPGFSLLMAPFAALGMPWACNPALSALSLLLIGHLADRLFGPRAAGWATLLTLASPAFMAYGISFYSMAAHNLLNLAYAALLLAPSPLSVLAAGFVGGWALVLHQPFCHAMFGLPWIVWLASRPGRFRTLLLLAVGYVAVYVPIGLGWDHLEKRLIAENAAAKRAVLAMPAEPTAATAAGGPERSLLDVWLDAGRGIAATFRIPDAFRLWIRLVGLAKLIAWAAPALVPLACLGAVLDGRRVPAALFAASAALTFTGYVFVIHDQGHGWGYRYFHSAWGCLPILASAPLAAGTAVGRSLTTRIGCAAIASLLLIVPYRAAQIEHFVAGHRAQEPPVDAALLRQWGTRVLVFIQIKGGLHRFDMIQNDPFLATGPLRLVGRDFATDAGNAAAIAAGQGGQARLVSSDERGSVWIVVPGQPAAEKPGF